MTEKEIYYTIEKITKHEKGVTFYIASSLGTKFEMLVSPEQYERFDLEEGEMIDDRHFMQIREEMLFDNARRQAFSILSFGENNTRTLSAKLQKKGFSKELSDNVTLYMVHRGFIDEKKQIALLCDEFLRKKFGKLKIINELILKGYLRDDVIAYVQNELQDVNFAENCAYIIEHKYMPLPKDTAYVQKMVGALMKYGYTVPEIKEAVVLCQKK